MESRCCEKNGQPRQGAPLALSSPILDVSDSQRTPRATIQKPKASVCDLSLSISHFDWNDYPLSLNTNKVESSQVIFEMQSKI
jgi:hypothetical protein